MGCAFQHRGAVSTEPSAKCEDCLQQKAQFGLPPRRKKRWCGGCAKVHAGAVDCRTKMCEDCHAKPAGLVLPSDEKKTRRWCGACAVAHPGAVRASHGRVEPFSSLPLYLIRDCLCKANRGAWK